MKSFSQRIRARALQRIALAFPRTRGSRYSIIPKSGRRISDRIMLNQKARSRKLALDLIGNMTAFGTIHAQARR
jgi:hypothetical protein